MAKTLAKKKKKDQLKLKKTQQTHNSQLWDEKSYLWFYFKKSKNWAKTTKWSAKSKISRYRTMRELWDQRNSKLWAKSQLFLAKK